MIFRNDQPDRCIGHKLEIWIGFPLSAYG